MKKIISVEGLEAAVADTVRLKIHHTQIVAAKDNELAAVEKKHQTGITENAARMAEAEDAIQAYCAVNRVELFPDKKSRETGLAVFGFEMTPPRVETANKKIKWKDVLERLKRLGWGKAYVRQPPEQPDKEAMLADREKLTPEQLTAAGIQFCQEEQFYIRPKPETAKLQG